MTLIIIGIIIFALAAIVGIVNMIRAFKLDEADFDNIMVWHAGAAVGMVIGIAVAAIGIVNVVL